MKRTILVGVLSICLNAFALDGLSSNDTAMLPIATSLNSVDVQDPYHNLPDKDIFYPCVEILAHSLNLKTEDLFALINYETGGRMNPKVASKNSSAKGLLQFTNITAKNLLDKNGNRLSSSKHLTEAYPTIKDQLEIPTSKNKYGGPIYQYLKKYAPFKSTEDLFISVIYPSSRRSQRLPRRISRQNAGIRNARDFVNRARRNVESSGIIYE